MVGKIVSHIRFGRGEIIEYNAPRLKVRFEESAAGEKQFDYPQAFERFLRFEDASMHACLERDLESIRQAAHERGLAQVAASRLREIELMEIRKAEQKAKRAASARKAAAARSAARKKPSKT